MHNIPAVHSTCMKKYPTVRGGTTLKKAGVLMDTTMNTPSVSKTQKRKSSRISGSLASVTSTSLESLFTILPRGVVSKKRRGDLNKLSSKFSWSNLAAPMTAEICISC